LCLLKILGHNKFKMTFYLFPFLTLLNFKLQLSKKLYVFTFCQFSRHVTYFFKISFKGSSKDQMDKINMYCKKNPNRSASFICHFLRIRIMSYSRKSQIFSTKFFKEEVLRIFLYILLRDKHQHLHHKIKTSGFQRIIFFTHL
jgi:hypothetical protein